LLGGGVATTSPAAFTDADDPVDAGVSDAPDVNRLSAMRRTFTATGAETIEIELASNREFLPHGELLVLRIGAQEFDLSRYPNTGDTRTVIFALTPEQFGRIVNGDAVTIHYGAQAPGRGWNFGPVDKNMLR
jgi:hypothetical protein